MPENRCPVRRREVGCWKWIYAWAIFKISASNLLNQIEAEWSIYALVNKPSLVQIWLVAKSAQIHYLNKCCNIVNSKLISINIFQWHLKRNSYICIQENTCRLWNVGHYVSVSMFQKLGTGLLHLQNARYLVIGTCFTQSLQRHLRSLFYMRRQWKCHKWECKHVW